MLTKREVVDLMICIVSHESGRSLIEDRIMFEKNADGTQPDGVYTTFGEPEDRIEVGTIITDQGNLKVRPTDCSDGRLFEFEADSIREAIDFMSDSVKEAVKAKAAKTSK